MGSPRQFDGFVDVVCTQGCSVAALLLPGHGGTAEDFASGTYEHWQRHVDDEVERYSHNNANIWLVGHSMGGLLAINAAVKYSRYVRGIFLIACPFKITTFSLYAAKVRFKQIFSQKNDPIKAAYRDSGSVSPSISLIWRTAKPALELRKLMRVARGNLPELRLPVTAVYSSADELTSIKSLDILRSELREAPFEQVVLTDSLHAYYPQHEWSVIESTLTRAVSTDDAL